MECRCSDLQRRTGIRENKEAASEEKIGRKSKGNQKGGEIGMYSMGRRFFLVSLRRFLRRAR
jgi:hypothetical protein